MIGIVFATTIMSLLIAIFSYLMLSLFNYVVINLTVSVCIDIYFLLRFSFYFDYLKKRILMFTFIELFTLNFDVQKTIPATLGVVIPLLSVADQRMLTAKRQNEGMVYLEGLTTFFAHHYYESFLSAIKLVSERGGDIMQVSEILLFSLANSQAQLVKIKRIDNTYLVKFIFNWLFIFAVGILFRFALDGFLAFSNPPLTYILGIEIFIGVFLVSLVLVTENRIRRIKNVT